jgi:DNA-binding SARP family transcriptional activator/CheY-like chemotaxis protein
VEFRILGPVEAYAAGDRVELGTRKDRFVLAVLALNANRPVSVDRLVELLWPVEPPRTAEHAVAVSVSHLRSALATAASEVRIVRQGRAYVLRTDAMSVDAHRFRALVDDARAANDDARAVELLDEALLLWRGEALACCAPDGVDTALCRGLTDARLTAVEDRADARLRLGQHRALLDGLSDLVARHPLRERLAGQLMLALHRDGRTAEALAVYQALRDRLAAELGLDPGERLRTLHGAVLRDDPTTQTPTTQTQTPATQTPTTQTPTTQTPASPATVGAAGGPADPATLRVVLVDDHPMFRAGMRVALETGTEIVVVAEAGDVAGTLPAVAETSPDIVIMDLDLPDGTGLQATRLLLARHPGLAILMMTMSSTEAHIIDALRAGARGYVLKSANRSEVLAAVRTVTQGGAVFSADVAMRIAALAGASYG